MPYRIDLLARHHQRLLDIMDTASPLITAKRCDADLRGLRYLRIEMEEALNSYESFVLDDVWECSMWSALPEGSADARKLLASCVQLRADYDSFVNRWSEDALNTQWSRYRLNARLMMQQVKDHVLQAATMSKRWISVEAA